MRKHSWLPSIVFLVLLANEFNLEFLRSAQAEEIQVPRYAVHYIQKGDNLHLLAAYYLDSPRKWEIIFNENRRVITTPNQLVIGRKLVIPVSKSWSKTEPYEKFKVRLETKLDLDDLATELLGMSRVYGKIQGVPSQIKNEVERDSLQFGGTPEQIDLLKRNIAEIFQPAGIAALIARKLKASLDETELKELFKWYSSPLGIKITELANEGVDPEKWKTAPAEYERVKEVREKDIHRVEMLNDLDLTTRYSEREIELKRNVFFAVASVSFKNVGTEKNFEELRTFVNERKADFFSALEDEMIFTLISIYTDLSEDELNEYVNFLKTSASQKFTEIISETLNEQLVSSFSPTPQLHVEEKL